jgi:hypothetical protein
LVTVGSAILLHVIWQMGGFHCIVCLYTVIRRIAGTLSGTLSTATLIIG